MRRTLGGAGSDGPAAKQRPRPAPGKGRHELADPSLRQLDDGFLSGAVDLVGGYRLAASCSRTRGTWSADALLVSIPPPRDVRADDRGAG